MPAIRRNDASSDLASNQVAPSKIFDGISNISMPDVCLATLDP